jgi:hypothetical protein
MDHTRIAAEWKRLVARCDAKVAECMADPEAAALEGLEPVYDNLEPEIVTFGGRSERQPRGEVGGWLRAVAQQLIDTEIWNYKIYEVIGGKAYLALLSFKADDDYEFVEPGDMADDPH